MEIQKNSRIKQEHDVLVVPGTGFGTDTHIRLSCVWIPKCEKALIVFEK